MTTLETMHAVTIDAFGGADSLQPSIRDRPAPGAGEVLVKLAYAGVGPWDRMEREGMFAKMSGKPGNFPKTLGMEGAGIVAAIGSGVERFHEGDQVYAIAMQGPAGGGFNAEYVAVDAAHVGRVPAGLGLDEAGAMPIAALTALQGVDDILKIEHGESLLIFGASGDLGMMAVQFAKRRGARVLAIAAGDDGVAAVRELGADAALDGTTADVAAAATAFAPDGLDAVLAFAGGPALEVAIAAMRAGGRVAFPNGIEPVPAERPDVTISPYSMELVPGSIEKLERAIDAAPFSVRVAQVFPLDRAAEAQEALSRHRVGKLILQMDG